MSANTQIKLIRRYNLLELVLLITALKGLGVSEYERFTSLILSMGLIKLDQVFPFFMCFKNFLLS